MGPRFPERLPEIGGWMLVSARWGWIFQRRGAPGNKASITFFVRKAFIGSPLLTADQKDPLKRDSRRSRNNIPHFAPPLYYSVFSCPQWTDRKTYSRVEGVQYEEC